MGGVTGNSPEIEAIVRRWTTAVREHQVADLPFYLSQSEAVLYVGTSHGEIWRGHVVREGISDHFTEVPDFAEDDVEIEAWENGDMGWAFYRSRFHFPSTGATGVHRITFVLLLEHGGWKIVHQHLSQPDSNVEKMGVEHSALRNLVEAAKGENLDFGTEGLASIMFTDIVNSSPVAAALGDRAWSGIVSGHFRELHEIVAAQGGHFVKSLGDGTMSSFSSARGALSAAREIQQAMAAQQQEPRLSLRIGLHTGDVVQSEDDFFGSVVNKAARITDLAEAGEVVLSDVTRAMVGDTPEFSFAGPSSVRLKGFAGKHLVHRMEWEA